MSDKYFITAVCFVMAFAAGLMAEEGKTIRVPGDFPSIQQAIDRAEAGETVLVSAGSYCQHIVLKEGVCLRSEGDDSPGQQEYAARRPLKRAERTIIDVKGSTQAAVVAGAEGATLDGFTVTGLGHVNHHLPNHAHAVECRNCSATIINNIIRDNGSTGIGQHAKKGATIGLVAAPYVADNFVFRNMGIGIGNNHRLGKNTASRLAANEFSDPGRLGDVFHGRSNYGVLAHAGDPREFMRQFRPDPAILGPGPTENFFRTGQEEHSHDESGHGHEH